MMSDPATAEQQEEMLKLYYCPDEESGVSRTSVYYQLMEYGAEKKVAAAQMLASLYSVFPNIRRAIPEPVR